MFEGTSVAPGTGSVDPALLDEIEAGYATFDDGGWVPDAVPDWLTDGAPPRSYGNTEPSGWLALELDDGTADPAELTDDVLVEAIVGFDRLASWAAARQARLLVELAARRPADAAPHTARNACVGSEFAPDEIGVALTLSRGTAAARLAMASTLLTVLPATHALWESGRIDTPKVRAILDATAVLADEVAVAVQDRVLARAPEQTLAQLKAALARAVIAADPQGADSRHREARRDRRVVINPESDGMGSLWALLTATDAAGAWQWLTRLARGLGSDDPRTMDARRADILAALLNGRLVTDPGSTETDEQRPGDGSCGDAGASPVPHGSGSGGPASGGPGSGGPGSGGPASGGSGVTGAARGGTGAAANQNGRPIEPVTPGKPLIQIVIAHSTLLGEDDQPAELVGYGPVPAALAREAAADGVWRRLVTDPLSGAVLDYGRTTYHPPAALADHVRVRDVYCRGPGCRRKAADAELDHTVAWADGGTTSADNLGAMCKHDHLLKHHAGWRLTVHPDGRLTWTTPTGRRHTTAPHDYRPDPPPPSSPPPSSPSASAGEVETPDPQDEPPPF